MDLNKPEPKAVMLRRLQREARGVKHRVSVAEALEFRREEYGLTAAEFADVLGLQKGHYSEVVNGRRPLPINATRRAFWVGVPAHVLLQPKGALKP